MYHYGAKCVRVVDGDTVDLEVDLGFHLKATMRFRLLGVNCPEMNDPLPPLRQKAIEAKDFVISKIGDGRQLTINTEKADSFGRWLADIFYTEGAQKSLSIELINAGLAVAYTR